MPFPNWALSGVFRTLQNTANKTYGAVDKNIFSGALPGGADNPYVGKSVNKRKAEQAQNFVREFTGVNAASALLNQAAVSANNVVNKLRTNPATQVPLSTIEKVQEFLNPKLKTPVNFTGFIDHPDAFWNNENRVNVKGVLSDADRAKYTKDLQEFNDRMSSFLEDLRNPTLNIDATDAENRYLKLKEQEPRLKNYATYSAPIALHEFGHALNFADPSLAQSERNWRYGKQVIQPGTIAGLSVGRSSKDENRNLWQAGLEGLLGNVTAPGPRHTIAEEALASRNALQMANELGLPKGRRLLGAALGTYVAPPAAQGFSEGIIGELAGRGAEKLADVITDYVIDPVVDRFRGSDYSGLEQSLRQYGYDESKHRLKGTGYGGPFQVEFK